LEVNFGNQPENGSPPKTATVVGRRQCLRDDGCRVSSQSEPETLLDRKTQVVGHSLVASTPGLSTRSGNLFARNQSQGETVMQVAMDGLVQRARPEELLVDLINRAGVTIPHVRYQPQLDPIQEGIGHATAERDFGSVRRIISKDSLRALAKDFIHTAPHN
jgi:hypothetical protein